MSEERMQRVGVATYTCAADGCDRTAEAVVEEGLDANGWYGRRVGIPDGWTTVRGRSFYCPDHPRLQLARRTGWWQGSEAQRYWSYSGWR